MTTKPCTLRISHQNQSSHSGDHSWQVMALPPVDTPEGTDTEKGPMEERNFEKTVSWTDFTQTTTFHGVRYVFQDSPLKLRRPIWLTVVISSVFVFIIQVGMRMGDYFQYKTTVDVEIIYTDKLEFPAVTICNQNRFRITKAVEQGLYGVIDEIFKTTNISGIDWDKFDEKVDGIDFENFTLATAHQKRFLIDSCTWNGVDCDIDEDFQTVITDLGVCYTFNWGKNNSMGRQTTEAGVGSGLKLVINVEQYEYMRGPENDAGVKILLHPSSEAPLMREQGFAAAPGTHTLVGMKKFEIRSMTAPFGTCQQKNTPVSHCLERCRARRVIRKCGCRAVFMNNNINRGNATSLCDFKQSLSCVRQAYMDLRSSALDCECRPPCLEARYKPHLSYAQLSKFNIDRMILDDREKQMTLTEAYHKALETTQRYKKDIVDKDRKDMTRLWDLAQGLRKSLNAHALALNNASSAATTYKLPPIFLDDFFREDIRKIYDKIREAYSKTYRFYPFVFYRLNYTLKDIKERFLERKIDELSLEEKLTSCEKMMAEALRENDSDGSGEVGTDGSDNVTSTFGSQECMESLQAFTSYISFTNSSLTYSIRDLKELDTDQYLQVVNEVFNNTHKSPDDIEQHDSCLKALGTKDEIIDETSILLKYVNLTLTANTLFEFANGSRELREIVYGPTLEGLIKNLTSCEWLQNEIQSGSSDFYSSDDLVVQIHAGLLVSFMELSMTVVSMARGYEDRIDPIFREMVAYLNQSITKMELSAHMSSATTRQLIGDIDTFEDDAYRTIKTLQSKLHQLWYKIIPMYLAIFQSAVPLINMDQANELNIIKHTAATNQSHFNEVINGPPEKFHTNFEMMMKLISSKYDDEFEAILQDVVKPLSQVNKHLEDFQEDLAEFTKVSLLSVNFFLENFLQVDIFYADMSYQEVEQQEAFKFLSFVSEVGGFMGLLLGASVITICELLDYLIINVIRACARRRKVDPNVVKVRSAWDPV